MKFWFKQLPMMIIWINILPNNHVAYWKDTEIYEMLKKVGYVEKLEVKWNYKYRTVRAKIRLTKRNGRAISKRKIKYSFIKK